MSEPLNVYSGIERLRNALVAERIPNPYLVFYRSNYSLFRYVIETTDMVTLFMIIKYCTNTVSIEVQELRFVKFLMRYCGYPEALMHSWYRFLQHFTEDIDRKRHRPSYLDMVTHGDHMLLMYHLSQGSSTHFNEHDESLVGAVHAAIERDDNLMLQILLTLGKRSIYEEINGESAVVLAMRRFRPACLSFISKHTDAFQSDIVKSWIGNHETYRESLAPYLVQARTEIVDPLVSGPYTEIREFRAYYSAFGAVRSFHGQCATNLVDAVERLLVDEFIDYPKFMESFAQAVYMGLRLPDARILLISLVHSKKFSLGVYVKLYQVAVQFKDAHLILYLMNVSHEFYNYLARNAYLTDKDNEAAISAFSLYNWDPKNVDHLPPNDRSNKEWDYLVMMAKKGRTLKPTEKDVDECFDKYVKHSHYSSCLYPVESLVMAYLFHDKFKELEVDDPNPGAVLFRLVNYQHWLNFTLGDLKKYFEHFSKRVPMEGQAIFKQMARHKIYDFEIVKLLMLYGADPIPHALIQAIERNAVDHVKYIIEHRPELYKSKIHVLYQYKHYRSILDWMCTHKDDLSKPMTLVLQDYLRSCDVHKLRGKLKNSHVDRLIDNQQKLISKHRRRATLSDKFTKCQYCGKHTVTDSSSSDEEEEEKEEKELECLRNQLNDKLLLSI